MHDVLRVLLVLMILPGAALAQSLPEALVAMMRDDPAGFLDGMTDVVAGFGGADGLSGDELEEYLALERARARASALRQVLAMDLDNDGALTRAELAVSQRAASARQRGTLQRRFDAADRDEDGRLTPGELRADADAAGFRAMSEPQAAALRATLGFDADGDGRLTMAEVKAAIAALDDAT